MVFDRASEDADGPGEARPELHLHHGRTDGDSHAPQKEPPETRSRAECYDALRAADSDSDQGDETKREDSRAVSKRSDQGGGDYRPEASDAQEDKSGWDAVDAEERPPLDALHASPERTKHILDGDDTGGGHRHGTGNPGETEFPASWSDKKVIDTILDVARRPDEPPTYQDWNKRWLVRGTREEITTMVVIADDGQIWTGWPRPGGPGVVKNPKEG
jgi:hypothetical protein